MSIKMLRHVGRLQDTGSKVVVVFMSIPEDPGHALVTQVDSLSDFVKDEIMELVESAACQREDSLGVYLKRKTLRSAGDSTLSVLDWLHRTKKLLRISTDKVQMVPHPAHVILLSELNKIQQDSASVTANVEGIAPTTHNLVTADNVEDKKKVAENLLWEAQSLREDADQAASVKEKMAQELLASIEKKPKTKAATVSTKTKKVASKKQSN